MDISSARGLLGRNLWSALWTWPGSSLCKNRWESEIPSRSQRHSRDGSFLSQSVTCRNICSSGRLTSQRVLFGVTKAVCINPLAALVSHLIDIPPACVLFFFLLENFIWLSFLENPALPILQGQSELSRCCYFRELILALGSIVLPSALPPCSHTHGARSCMGRRVAGTSGLYRLTRKPCLGTRLSQFMLLSIPQGHLCMVKNKNSPAGKNMEKASTEWL